jgi:hypothetical protein
LVVVILSMQALHLEETIGEKKDNVLRLQFTARAFVMSLFKEPKGRSGLAAVQFYRFTNRLERRIRSG